MDEIKFLNSIYNIGGLLDGEYRDGKIIFNKFRSIRNKLMVLICDIVIISHILIFISDWEFLKNHLVQFKVSDGFFSRFLNLGGGLSIFVVNYPIKVYKKFTLNSNSLKPFNFLWCYDVEKMYTKYHLSELKSKDQIKFQLKIFKFVNLICKFYIFTIGLLFAKNCYDIVKNTSFTLIWLDYLVNFIKILSSVWFFISFSSIVMRFLVYFSEILICSKYLSNRLDDQLDEMTKLFKKDRILINRKYINNKFIDLINNYNLIIRDHSFFNTHFNETMTSLIALLIFTVLYPALVLNEPDKKGNLFLLIFHISDLLLIYSELVALFYFSGSFLKKVKYQLIEFKIVNKF